MLLHYTKHGRNASVTGPTKQWYALLMGSFILYPALLGGANTLFDQSGWVVLLGLIFTLLFYIIH